MSVEVCIGFVPSMSPARCLRCGGTKAVHDVRPPCGCLEPDRRLVKKADGTWVWLCQACKRYVVDRT